MAKVGDYNMTSDRSGFVYPRSEMRQEWTGRWVHYSEWEPQQPQEIITPKKDNQRVWPVRDEQPVVMVSAGNQTMPLIFENTANSNTVILNNGYSARSTLQSFSSDDGSAASNALTQNTTLTGVRFTLNTATVTSDINYFYVGFSDTEFISSSTKTLFAVIYYKKSTDTAILVAIGDITTGDITTLNYNLTTYQHGDQLCVSIKTGGYVQFDIEGYSANYTTSPAVDGLQYFTVFLYGVDATLTISQEASIFPTIADYNVSSVPSIPPSQLDSY